MDGARPLQRDPDAGMVGGVASGLSVLVPAVLVTIGATLLLGSLVPGRGSAATHGAAAGGQDDVTAPS